MNYYFKLYCHSGIKIIESDNYDDIKEMYAGYLTDLHLGCCDPDVIDIGFINQEE